MTARPSRRRVASLWAAAGAALVVGALAPVPRAAVPGPDTRTADAVPALPQVRDAGRGPAVVETANVSGTLVTDEATPRPVRRATMTLGGVPGYGRVTVTDNAGHFAFAGLPAGRFTLAAARPGYVTGTYGVRRPGRPGVPIAVGDGQHVDITMTIVRGAVITGTIVDPHGRPMPNVRVEALLATTAGGSGGLVEHRDLDDRRSRCLSHLRTGARRLPCPRHRAGAVRDDAAGRGCAPGDRRRGAMG